MISSGLNIGNSNPALNAHLKGTNISASYHYETKIYNSWLADIKHEREFNSIPQSVGFCFPINKSHWGFAFNQKYLSKLDYRKILVTILTPNGYYNIGSVKIISETKINNYSTSAAYKIYNSMNKKYTFNMGFRLNLYHLEFEERTTNVNLDTSYQDLYINPYYYSKSFLKPGFNIGLTYIYQNLLLGAFFEKGIEFKEKYKSELGDFYIIVNIPHKLSFGIKYLISNSLKINGGISHVLWNIDKSIKNQPELNSSIVYAIVPGFSTSFGFLYTDYIPENEDNLLGDKLRVVYLLTGTVFSFKNLALHLAFADSHLFSQAWRKQTIIKAGIVVNL